MVKNLSAMRETELDPWVRKIPWRRKQQPTPVFLISGFPGGSSGKEYACQCRKSKRREFDPWVREIPWSRKWQPISVFLPRKFHGQRSLVGYSPWRSKELDMTEHTHIFNFMRVYFSFLVA